MKDFVAQDEIFQKRRPPRTRLQAVLVVSDHHALRGCQGFAAGLNGLVNLGRCAVSPILQLGVERNDRYLRHILSENINGCPRQVGLPETMSRISGSADGRLRRGLRNRRTSHLGRGRSRCRGAMNSDRCLRTGCRGRHRRGSPSLCVRLRHDLRSRQTSRARRHRRATTARWWNGCRDHRRHTAKMSCAGHRRHSETMHGCAMSGCYDHHHRGFAIPCVRLRRGLRNRQTNRARRPTHARTD